MAPVTSTLTPAEENIVLNCLLRQYPALKVDMMVASSAVSEGENFMSVVTRLDVAAHLLKNCECINQRLIMKSLPKSEKRCLIFNCYAAFRNEATFYSTVLPLFTQLCGRLPFPSCLHASNDLIILSDLGKDGYVMADRKKGLDLQHCQTVLKQLGKFHATSLALKYLRPKDFSLIRSSVKEIFVTEDNAMAGTCVANCIDLALTAVTGMDCACVNKLKELLNHGLQLLFPLITPSEPMAVICHGDLWINNLLFQYSPTSLLTPTDVCFLDLQVCRYGSPAFDILYFLFSSSQPGVTRQNFHRLIKVYHSALTKHLTLLAPHAPVVSIDDIMHEIRQHAVFGLVMSIIVMPVVTAEEFSTNLDEATEESFQSEDFKQQSGKEFLTPAFKERIREMFEVFSIEELI